MKMRFHEDKFYKDPSKPIFLAGKVYEIEEKDGWAQRWIKRGGVEVFETETLEPAPAPVEDKIEDPAPVDIQPEAPAKEIDPVEKVDEVNEASAQDALDALSADEPEAQEEVAKEDVKVENKKSNTRKGSKPHG